MITLHYLGLHLSRPERDMLLAGCHVGEACVGCLEDPTASSLQPARNESPQS